MMPPETLITSISNPPLQYSNNRSCTYTTAFIPEKIFIPLIYSSHKMTSIHIFIQNNGSPMYFALLICKSRLQYNPQPCLSFMVYCLARFLNFFFLSSWCTSSLARRDRIWQPVTMIMRFCFLNIATWLYTYWRLGFTKRDCIFKMANYWSVMYSLFLCRVY